MKRYAYLGLALLFGFTFTFRIRDSLYNVHRMLHPHEFARDPFDIAEPETTVVSVQPEAEAAGIRRGDVLIGVEGRPYTGAADLHSVLRAAAGGSHIGFEFRSTRLGTRLTTVRLEQASAPASARVWAQIIIGEVAMPFLCLALGFWVAAVRIRDPQAWILLLLLISFAEQGGASSRTLFGFDDPFKYVAAFYQPLLGNLWPVSMLLFGIYFPERIGVDRRWPWMKWIVITPLLFRSFQDGMVSVLQLHHAPLAQGLESFLPYSTAFTIVQMVAVGLFFSATGYKTGTLTNPDARRRLLLLHTGATVSLSPIFILLLINLATGRNFLSYPAWIFTTVVLMLFLFPLTLAYVIVVQRAMDVRVVVRQGAQYLLAKGSVRFLQVTLSAIVLTYIMVYTGGARGIVMPWSQRLLIFGLGIAAVILLSKFADAARGWLDRRFFREAYNAEQILSDLADKVRTIVEIGPLLETVAQRISESLHVPRVAVLVSGGGTFRLAYAFGYAKPPDVALDEESSTVRHLREEHHARVYSDDADSWVQRTPETEKAALQQLEAQLLLPLSLNQKMLGILSLGPKRSEEPYSRSDLRLLLSVATQTGLALQNSRLTAEIASEVAQRERLNREIEIAREVQERLFPQELPPVVRFDYAGACRPALGVGGDYYDFLPLPDDKLGMAIGDVSGKGIPAALLMASLRASLRGQTIQGTDDLAALMSNVNKLVYESSSSNRYATFFYAQYDPKTNVLSYVNAGHNPPLVFRGNEVIRLEAGGPVVGLLPTIRYEQAAISLQSGDILVAFTDGISEAMNGADEEWGEDRLIECVREGAGLAAQDLLQRTMMAADAFVAGASQHDDMTIIVARVG